MAPGAGEREPVCLQGCCGPYLPPRAPPSLHPIGPPADEAQMGVLTLPSWTRVPFGAPLPGGRVDALRQTWGCPLEAVAPREWLVHRLCAHRRARGLLLCCFVLAAPSPLSCPPPRLSHSLGRWAAEWLLVPRSVLLFPLLVSCGPQALAEEAPPPSAPSDWPGAELEVL